MDKEQIEEQRPIKFRAWDKNEGKMWWFDLLWGNTLTHGSGWIGMVESPTEGKYVEGTAKDNRVQVDPMDKIIMQYTGLKEKNGKEIYEGDIFRITRYPPENNKVEFYEGCYHLEPHGLDLFEWYEQGEVIGNIYENPELLT